MSPHWSPANDDQPASGVTPGTYGDAANVPQVTVDVAGRVTAAVDVPISGGGGGITDLTSTGGTVTVTSPTGPTANVDLPASGVAAGTYGDATNSAQVTIDAEGRVTAASDVPISGGGGGGGSDAYLVQIMPLFGYTAKSGVWNLASLIESTAWLNGHVSNYPGTNTDFVEWPVVLSAGTWTLEWFTRTQTFMAIQTVTLDGSALGTFDAYSASGSVNVVASIAGIAVATSGLHLLRFATPTRNASATQRAMGLGLISLKRTA